MSNLTILRKQLEHAIKFMEDTPTIISHHVSLWWSGGMPAYPEEYDPDDWTTTQPPISETWAGYLHALETDISELADDWPDGAAKLRRHLERARSLPIADLLAN